MANRKINNLIFPLLFAVLILVASVLPTNIKGEPPSFYFKGLDKIIHALMYGILAFLLLNAYFKNKPLLILPFILLICGTWIYSIFMELLQYFVVEYRTGDALDALANLAGIVAASLLFIMYKRLRS